MRYDDLKLRRGKLLIDPSVIEQGPIGGSIMLEIVKQGVVGIKLEYDPSTSQYCWIVMSPMFPPVAKGSEPPVYDLLVDIDLKVNIQLPQQSTNE